MKFSAHRVFFSLLYIILSADLTQLHAETLVIHNITLIDGTGSPPMSGISVKVEGGYFTKITSQRIDTDPETLNIDGNGKFLMPGIIDSHVHLPGGRTGPRNTVMTLNYDIGKPILQSYLFSGVTAIYDSGNNKEYILKLRSQERAGSILAPRIYATLSLIAPPNGHGCCAGGTVVSDYQSGLQKLDKILKLKPDLLKFTREHRGMGLESRNIPLMEEDLLKKLIAHAHERGVRSTVHVSDPDLAIEALRSGADAFAHTVYLAPVSQQWIETVVKAGVILSTTMSRIETNSSFLKNTIYQDTVEPDLLAEIMKSERFAVEGSQVSPLVLWLQSLRPIIMKNFKNLHDSGAILALGTDKPLGPIAHHELELMVEAGISALDAIKIGTLNSARYIGVDSTIGSIEVGKLADMLLLNADPSIDIRNTLAINSVFKNGVLIDRASLDVPVNRNFNK